MELTHYVTSATGIVEIPCGRFMVQRKAAYRLVGRSKVCGAIERGAIKQQRIGGYNCVDFSDLVARWMAHESPDLVETYLREWDAMRGDADALMLLYVNNGTYEGWRLAK